MIFVPSWSPWNRLWSVWWKSCLVLNYNVWFRPPTKKWRLTRLVRWRLCCPQVQFPHWWDHRCICFGSLQRGGRVVTSQKLTMNLTIASASLVGQHWNQIVSLEWKRLTAHNLKCIFSGCQNKQISMSTRQDLQNVNQLYGPNFRYDEVNHLGNLNRSNLLSFAGGRLPTDQGPGQSHSVRAEEGGNGLVQRQVRWCAAVGIQAA